MIFKAMINSGLTLVAAPAIGLLTLLVLLVGIATLTGCSEPRYEADSPPHETWKDRGEYCFAVEVDPLGADNSTYFWADEVEEGYSADGLSNVRARDVRVSDRDWNEGPGGADHDFYQPGIVRIIEDGSIEIDQRCY